VRFAVEPTDALAVLATEAYARGGTVLSYKVTEREPGGRVTADVTVEISDPQALPHLLDALRSRPHVDRIRSAVVGRVPDRP